MAMQSRIVVGLIKPHVIVFNGLTWNFMVDCYTYALFTGNFSFLLFCKELRPVF